jgi:hypothetical protein
MGNKVYCVNESVSDQWPVGKDISSSCLEFSINSIFTECDKCDSDLMIVNLIVWMTNVLTVEILSQPNQQPKTV